MYLNNHICGYHSCSDLPEIRLLTFPSPNQLLSLTSLSWLCCTWSSSHEDEKSQLYLGLSPLCLNHWLMVISFWHVFHFWTLCLASLHSVSQIIIFYLVIKPLVSPTLFHFLHCHKTNSSCAIFMLKICNSSIYYLQKYTKNLKKIHWKTLHCW